MLLVEWESLCSCKVVASLTGSGSEKLGLGEDSGCAGKNHFSSIEREAAASLTDQMEQQLCTRTGLVYTIVEYRFKRRVTEYFPIRVRFG
jgi:hypothetical protein